MKAVTVTRPTVVTVATRSPAKIAGNELAARMNAMLEIASEPGDTTFTLTLAPDEG